MTEDEMAGWHHWLNGCEAGWTLGVGDGQGVLACCNSWGHKESDTTERLNRTELAPSRVLWSRLLHYSLLTDSFISSRSLLNISCIFLILVSSLFMCNSILFPRFWIICTNIILNSFQGDSLSPPLLFGLVGIYHVPLPAEYFSAFSFCFSCCGWGALFVGWKFMVPLSCGACSLWVGLNKWLVKVSWLGELTSVFWWVELDLFSLEGNEVSSIEFWGVYGFGMALGSLSFNAQSCVPALLEN